MENSTRGSRRLAGIAAALVLFLGSSPAWADVVILGPLAHDLEVQPGRAFEGEIRVQNPGDRPQEIRVYQTDYLFFADGRSLYDEPGRLPRSNARWITFGPRQATIPPQETLRLRFTVQVPQDASLRGSYWSMLMVEGIPETSPESSIADPARLTVGVQEVLRYGIQVAAHVGSTGTRKLGFTQVKLSKADQKVVLAVDVDNQGERFLQPSLWVDLYDPGGKYVGKFQAGPRRTYPGTSVRFTVDLLGLEAVTYKSLIVADCGGEDAFGANVDLVLGH